MKFEKGDKVVFRNEMSTEVPWGTPGTVLWAEKHSVRVAFSFLNVTKGVTCSPYELHSRKEALDLL